MTPFFLRRFLQNCRLPTDTFGGRLILRHMSVGHRPLWEWTLSALPGDFAPGAIADIGCGGGEALALLAARYPQAKELFGFDLSPTSVAWAQRCNRHESRVRVSQADANQLPLAGGTVELATAFETVYFWQPIAGSFREIFRVLRPGGMFLVGCEVNDPEKAAPFARRIEGMTAYTAEDLASALRTAGFDRIETAAKDLWMRLLAHKTPTTP
jgi:SAM-dependent methyltransferase